MANTAIRSDAFTILLDAAKNGNVIVADVFAAMRMGVITQEQCKEILTTFERVRVPTWQRVITTSSWSS